MCMRRVAAATAHLAQRQQELGGPLSAAHHCLGPVQPVRVWGHAGKRPPAFTVQPIQQLDCSTGASARRESVQLRGQQGRAVGAEGWGWVESRQSPGATLCCLITRHNSFRAVTRPPSQPLRPCPCPSAPPLHRTSGTGAPGELHHSCQVPLHGWRFPLPTSTIATTLPSVHRKPGHSNKQKEDANHTPALHMHAQGEASQPPHLPPPAVP